MKRLEALLEWGGTRRDIIFLIVSGLSLLASIFDWLPLPFDAAWVAIVLCGLPIVLEAIIGLVTRFDIKADVLVSMALVASIAIGEDFAAGEVAFIMQLGALLEELTVARARAGIEKLVRLTPRTARVLRNGGEEIIPAEQVQIGDRLRVLPGETIPVDGVIRSGHTSVNQAVMTGESLPVDLEPGDSVASGTVNQFGAFEMEATRVGEDSSIQRMIRLVQSAEAGKAKIVGLADHWATWVVVIALVAAIGTYLVTGKPIRAVTILVVFCPCALVLATPTAIMAAIGNATRHGFLVREGDALERLSQVTTCTFDKTGTLTCGTPRVSEVRSCLPDVEEARLYTLAAAAELQSEHPLGKAVVRCRQAVDASPLPPAEDFHLLPGRGVAARVEGMELLAGNPALLAEHGIPSEGLEQLAAGALHCGCTVIYVALDGRPAGFLALEDTVRPQAADMLRQLRQTGVIPVLLTGDHAQAARHLASSLGIDRLQADCRPEGKLSYIDKAQAAGDRVCMIGDGINDAPALKKARVGIAMGGIGSDIAVEAADIALVNDDLRELPHLIRLARRMMVIIRCNLTFSMTLNFVSIVLAMTGMLSPILGALVHNAGSVLVIVNSAFLLGWKARR